MVERAKSAVTQAQVRTRGAREAPVAWPQSKITFRQAEEQNGDLAFFFRIKRIVAHGWSDKRIRMLQTCLEAARVLTTGYADDESIREALRILSKLP